MWSFLKLSALIFSLFNSNSSYKFVTALCLNVLPHLKQMSSYQPSALDPTTTTPVFANMMKLARSHESWVVVLLTKLWNVLRQLLLFAMCAVVLLTVLVLLVPIFVTLSFKLYYNLLPLYSLLTGDN